MEVFRAEIVLSQARLTSALSESSAIFLSCSINSLTVTGLPDFSNVKTASPMRVSFKLESFSSILINEALFTSIKIHQFISLKSQQT